MRLRCVRRGRMATLGGHGSVGVATASAIPWAILHLARIELATFSVWG